MFLPPVSSVVIGGKLDRRSSSGTVVMGPGAEALVDAAPRASLAEAAAVLGDGGVGDRVVEADRLKKGLGGGAGPKNSCADVVGSKGVSRKVSATTVVTAGIPRSGSMC